MNTIFKIEENKDKKEEANKIKCDYNQEEDDTNDTFNIGDQEESTKDNLKSRKRVGSCFLLNRNSKISTCFSNNWKEKLQILKENALYTMPFYTVQVKQSNYSDNFHEMNNLDLME